MTDPYDKADAITSMAMELCYDGGVMIGTEYHGIERLDNKTLQSCIEYVKRVIENEL